MRNLRRIAVLLAALCLACCWAAVAENAVSTNVVMRVSRLVQDSVVNEGEELSMEVNMEGMEPASYQWYFNDVPIDGAVQKVYNIVNAREEDAGVYRLDAFDANGKMVLSVDLAVRVVSKKVPQSGDASLPLSAVLLAMGAAAALLTVKVRRASL